MKGLLGLSLLCLMAAPVAFASGFNCNHSVKTASPNTVVFKAVNQAASLHAYFDDADIKKSGPVFDVFVLQSCSTPERDFQAFSANFRVKAKAPRGKAEIYTCLTKQKRQKGYDKRWTRWFNVLTECRLDETVTAGSDYRDPPFAGGTGNGSGDYRLPSPDELYDPDFQERRPDYGPDSYYDGNGDRAEPEFSDIRF
ncbi:MAG: hypothetical protein NDJ90_06750 [Oligoflexia bacterium]|nr:hypothetical protein [Oligoflexia bacterium]